MFEHSDRTYFYNDYLLSDEIVTPSLYIVHISIAIQKYTDKCQFLQKT